VSLRAWSLPAGGIIAKVRIAVFGTGPVGRALAGGLLNRGHSVAVGTRAPDDPAVVARLADLPGVSMTTHRDAAEQPNWRSS
jgi:predicted dinucleotide-binding enzyme